MPIPIAFMLAAQGAGMVFDYLGTQDSIDMARKGAELQQQEIEKQIQYARLAAADESLRSMVNLRKNLGSQAAYFAARGVGGSAPALFATESTSNFNTDERMRKINLLAAESQLRAGQKISKLHEEAYENDQWNSFIKRTVNNIPTSPEAYKGIGGSFGLNNSGANKGI